MKVPVLIYEGFAEFEMTLLGFIARQEKNVISTVARTTPRVTGAGGLTVRAGPTLSQVNPDEYNALVVPGGQRDGLLDRDEVCGLIRRFNDSGKRVAAICSAPVQLARAGVLAGPRYTTSLSRKYRDLFARGTLAMPTMTGSSQLEPYDPATTPAKNMGIVAETFCRMPGVL